MYISKYGYMYLGDMQQGDRKATADEVAAWEAARAESPVAAFVRAMEALYDRVAQAKKYDNRFTFALRAGYAGPFQAEGMAFALWMDACNAHGYTVLDDVKAGRRAMPTEAEFLAELPTAPW